MLKAEIIGNLGNDPELKYSAGGSALLQFNVASNYRTKSQDGEWEDKTEWVRCIVFGNRAETLAQHLKKGMKVYVDGRLEARPWTAKDGSIRAGLELAANAVEFMSPRQSDDNQPARASVADERRRQPDDDLDLPF
jgi:single-strand DNA-binding protein